MRKTVLVQVVYDDDHGTDASYHFDHGRLVITFGPSTGVVPAHLHTVLRSQVEPVSTSGAHPDALVDTDGGIGQLARDQEIGEERRASAEEWQPRKVSMRDLAGIMERETGVSSLDLRRQESDQ